MAKRMTEKIYSWNINGLRAVTKKGFFKWFLKEEPDVLCLQETKLQKEQLTDEMLNVNGYYSHFSFAKRKGYSGVATYSKEKPITVKHGIGIEKFDSEGRILISEFKNYTLLNIYFPNGQMNDERLKYKLDFYDAMLSFCDELVKSGKKLVISGDYNTAHKPIDLKNDKANEKRSGFLPIEREWIDKLISHGYVDSFRHFYPNKIKYSWWSYRFNARANNAGWRIDYHFISQNLLDRVVDAMILDEIPNSDHCPIVIEIEK